MKCRSFSTMVNIIVHCVSLLECFTVQVKRGEIQAKNLGGRIGFIMVFRKRGSCPDMLCVCVCGCLTAVEEDQQTHRHAQGVETLPHSFSNLKSLACPSLLINTPGIKVSQIETELNQHSVLEISLALLDYASEDPTIQQQF